MAGVLYVLVKLMLLNLFIITKGTKNVTKRKYYIDSNCVLRFRQNKELFTLWLSCIRISYHFKSLVNLVLHMQCLSAMFAGDLELIKPNKSSEVKWMSLDRLPGQTTTIICFNFHRVTGALIQVHHSLEVH